MDKSRIGGVIICVATIVIAVLFLWGISLGGPWAYWAIAVPVIIGFLAILTLGFWIGWTMAVTEVEPPTPKTEGEAAPGGPGTSPS